MRWHELVDSASQDVRYAMRTLRKSPAFVTITVLTLALGIGANLAIFTLVNAVLLQPLPFREPDRLVRVFDDLSGAGANDVGMSVPELEDLRTRSGAFEQISAIVPVSVALSGGDQVERIALLGTNPNYFEMLGAKPAIGRVYTQAEWLPGFLDGVVISDGLWKRQFGGDSHVLGRKVRLDEDVYTIIGVMPAEFRHPGNATDGDVDVWGAAGLTAAPFPAPPMRGARIVPGALARLKQGVSLAQAQKRLDAITNDLEQAYPNDYPNRLRWSLRVEPAQTSLTGNVRPTLVILLAAVGFVLLIVCVNVASLFIARSAARMREYAVRQALGATRGQLVRLVLMESVLTSLLGGAAALVILRFAQTVLFAMIPPDIPRLTEVHTDWRTAAFALLLSLAAGVLVGLMPALHASSTDLNRDLREGGRTGGGQSARQNRSRSTLVVLQVALSAVLLVGAGLLVRSFSAALHQDPGFSGSHLVAGQVWVPVPNNPNANRYLTTPQLIKLNHDLSTQLAMIPGVQKSAIGWSGDVPFLNSQENPRPFSMADEAVAQQDNHAAEFGSVSPSYFDVLETPLKRGRLFTDFDTDTLHRVVVVNETFVNKFSPQRDLIGRRLRYGRGREAEVVGIVGDMRKSGMDVPPGPLVYESVLQRPTNVLAVLLRMRSEVDIKATNEAISQSVHRIDPELPVFGVRTLDDLMSASMGRRRFSLLLMSLFAVSALLLAALGIYGVMTFVVGQREQEFAIRLALGAEAKNIFALALRPGLVMTAIGTIAGLGVSFGAAHLIANLLFGVSASDPVTFLAVAALLAAVTIAACLFPAMRAMRASPIEALKQ